ncbi:hypothetical protein GCM10007298_36300 [Williamsia phyllosphaerae]|uniref:Uncharacterized protein n=1 Tax=Williamsia phyllosphaerae TaxID=885042 RepID=A0ABQ1V3I3_9NOCA|nr:hypothetical protein GCM10007298_36300 [Williamsia phyllosphaerae]
MYQPEQSRHRLVGEAGDVPDPQVPLGAVGDPSSAFDGRTLSDQQLAGVIGEGAAGRGEADPAPRPLQQLDTHRALESLDGLRERWLRHHQPCRRAADVFLVGDRNELLERSLGDLHVMDCNPG